MQSYKIWLTLSLSLSLSLSLVVVDVSAQNLSEVDGGPNYVAERPIFVDDAGERYSDLISIRFNQQILPDIRGLRSVPLDHFRTAGGQGLRGLFAQLESRFGLNEVLKSRPNKLWGENYTTHRATGATVELIDTSQKAKLIFDAPVPLLEVIAIIEANPFIEYADPPMEGYTIHNVAIPDRVPQVSFLNQWTAERKPIVTTPSDWAYVQNKQWELNSIGAPTAWDYSKGDGIEIGINDQWETGVTTAHPDLDTRLTTTGYFGGHMEKVAGIAGAETDNSNMASLGWQVDSLHATQMVVSAEVDRLVDVNEVDVINFSWITTGLSNGFKTALNNAFLAGVVLVASAGNDNCDPSDDCVYFPAAYGFTDTSTGEFFQTIAVSASMGNDDFRTGWNHSPGTDPIGDPTNAFIDIAAPGDSTVALTRDQGDGVWTLFNDGSTVTMAKAEGTSFSAPMVSATVALLRSMDGTLSVNDIYELITRSADKTGTNSYDANGWNQFMGYGRLDAGDATCFLDGACVPAAPTSLEIDNDGMIGQNPILVWNRSVNPTVEYEVYRAEIVASTPFSKIATVTGTTYTDLSVTISNSTDGDDKYSYKVKAVGYGSTSGFSNEAQSWGEEAFKSGLASAQDESVVYAFKLEGNHPNPFTSVTRLRFSIPESGYVQVVVRDVLGRHVSTILDRHLEEGFHDVDFDGSGLVSGTYFYTVMTDSNTESNIMVLQK